MGGHCVLVVVECVELTKFVPSKAHRYYNVFVRLHVLMVRCFRPFWDYLVRSISIRRSGFSDVAVLTSDVVDTDPDHE